MRIAAYVRRGENVIELQRDFSPLRRPDFLHAGRFQNIPGVELEPIYLIGDFANAMDYYFQAMALNEELEDSISIGILYINIGILPIRSL